MKKIKYVFSDGTKTEIEVEDDFADVIEQLDNYEAKVNRRETRRHTSFEMLQEAGFTFNDPEADLDEVLEKEENLQDEEMILQHEQRVLDIKKRKLEKQLTVRQAQAYFEFKFLKLKKVEIAKRMGVTEGAIRKLIEPIKPQITTKSLILKTIMQNEFSFHDNITEHVDNYTECANTIRNIYLSILNECERDNEIIKSLFFSDKRKTLQEVGEIYELTRERIRQILKKKTRIIKTQIARSYWMQTQINDTLANIGEKYFLEFLIYEIYITEFQAFYELFLTTYFDKDVALNLGFLIKQHLTTAPEYIDNLAWFEEKIFFPGERKVFDEDYIKGLTTKTEKEFLAYKNIESWLKRSNIIKTYVKLPTQLVYYETGINSHIPLYCVYTLSGNIVLVCYSPTLNMSFSYNLVRYRALHKFCKQNGFGYIVTNERKNTIFDIKNLEVDPKLESDFMELVNKRKFVYWKDVQSLKSKHKITNEILASLVLKHDLKMSLEPFFIKRNLEK